MTCRKEADYIEPEQDRKVFFYYQKTLRRRKNMKQKEYQKLLELVCNKQDSLLAHGLWDSEEYKQME